MSCSRSRLSLPRYGAPRPKRKRCCRPHARAGLSFGPDYNYVDDDIAQILGRLRYMQLMATQWAAEQEMSEWSQGGVRPRVHR